MRVELKLKNGRSIYGQKALGILLLFDRVRFGAIYEGNEIDTLEMPIYSCGQRIGKLIFDKDDTYVFETIMNVVKIVEVG